MYEYSLPAVVFFVACRVSSSSSSRSDVVVAVVRSASVSARCARILSSSAFLRAFSSLILVVNWRARSRCSLLCCSTSSSCSSLISVISSSIGSGRRRPPIAAVVFMSLTIPPQQPRSSQVGRNTTSRPPVQKNINSTYAPTKHDKGALTNQSRPRWVEYHNSNTNISTISQQIPMKLGVQSFLKGLNGYLTWE